MKPERMIEFDPQEAADVLEEIGRDEDDEVAVVNDEDICDKCGHVSTRQRPVYSFRIPSTHLDPEEWVFECGKCTKRIREELPY
jgi:hypothetical protein